MTEVRMVLSVSKLDFGVRDLNRLFTDVDINGGIIFVLGTPDSGYEIFAKTILLSEDEYSKIALLGKETKDEFMKAIKTYDIGKTESVKVLELGSYVFRRFASTIEKLSRILSTGDLTTLLEQEKTATESEGSDIMTYLISRIHGFSKAKILVDFIDMLIEEYSLSEISRTVAAIMTLSKIKDNFFIITMEKDLNPELERKIVSLSDIVFLLYSKRKSIDEKLRIMEILKIKNYPHLQFYATYTFVRNEGIKIEHIQRI